MADKIIRKCSSLKITVDENNLVSLEDTPDEHNTKLIEFAMVGKVNVRYLTWMHQNEP